MINIIMPRQKEYNLEQVNFAGQAISKKNRKVIKGSTTGLLTLPNRFVGQSFDVILIPNETRQ